jgi:Uncharacterized protein related to Endonuclease III
MKQLNPIEEEAILENHSRILLKNLLEVYGFQYWWPAESPLLVIIGAILTQNSKWDIVENIITKFSNLTDKEILSLKEMELQKIIKGISYFRMKSRYLYEVFKAFKEIEIIGEIDRDSLLKVKGIGKETADSIMLYAFNEKTIPIDMYTLRFLGRYFSLSFSKKDHELIRKTLIKTMNTLELKEFHALIVEHSKQVCKKEPLCQECKIINCNYRTISLQNSTASY